MLILLIVLKILLYLLLTLLGLALLLLLIPFSYTGQVMTTEGFRVQLMLGWAWKLLGINAEIEGEDYDITLRVLNRRVYKLKTGADREKEEEAKKQPEKKETDKKDKKGLGFKELTDRTLIKEILEYFKLVLNIAKPKYMHLYGTYGFEDPSLTGIVCGISGIVKGIIPNARIHLTPDFTREVMDLDLRAEGSMVMGSLAYQTVRTVLKKPVRKILFRKKKI